MTEVSTVVLVCVFMQSGSGRGIPNMTHLHLLQETVLLTQRDKSTLLLRNVCFDKHISEYIKFY